jgi:hypothetical protein
MMTLAPSPAAKHLAFLGARATRYFHKSGASDALIVERRIRRTTLDEKKKVPRRAPGPLSTSLGPPSLQARFPKTSADLEVFLPCAGQSWILFLRPASGASLPCE